MWIGNDNLADRVRVRVQGEEQNRKLTFIRGGSSSGSSGGTGLKCYICVGSICLNETTCSNSDDSCIKSFAGEHLGRFIQTHTCHEIWQP